MTATNTRTRMTLEEWMAEGKRRFGEDMSKWRFVCPACGHVQSPDDFRPHASEGATPDSARQECIGRYLPRGEAHTIFEKGEPCNYAAYGLFRLAPLVVTGHEGTEHQCFAFAEPGSS